MIVDRSDLGNFGRGFLDSGEQKSHLLFEFVQTDFDVREFVRIRWRRRAWNRRGFDPRRGWRTGYGQKRLNSFLAKKVSESIGRLPGLARKFRNKSVFGGHQPLKGHHHGIDILEGGHSRCVGSKLPRGLPPAKHELGHDGLLSPVPFENVQSFMFKAVGASTGGRRGLNHEVFVLQSPKSGGYIVLAELKHRVAILKLIGPRHQGIEGKRITAGLR